METECLKPESPSTVRRQPDKGSVPNPTEINGGQVDWEEQQLKPTGHT